MPNASPRGPLIQRRVMIVTSGRADSPAQALLEYLRRHEAPLVHYVSHPLSEDDGGEHLLRTLRHGDVVDERRMRRPSRPPWTYPLDVTAPLRLPAVDTWLGFTCLAAGQGL